MKVAEVGFTPVTIGIAGAELRLFACEEIGIATKDANVGPMRRIEYMYGALQASVGGRQRLEQVLQGQHTELTNNEVNDYAIGYRNCTESGTASDQ